MGIPSTNRAAAIYCENHFETMSLLVTNTTFTGNTAGESGGGVACDPNGKETVLTFVDTLFEAKLSRLQAARSAIFSEIALAHCTFVGNSASFNGGAILNAGEATIVGTIFSGNTSHYNGGAIYCSRTLQMTNSTLVGNRASRSGGGLYVYGVSADASLANTIVAKNRAGTAAPDVRHASGSLAGSNNLIGDGSGTDGARRRNRRQHRGNRGGSGRPAARYAIRPPAPTEHGEPRDDDYGDLRPRNDSPAVDAGDNALLPADSFDLDDDGDTSEQLPVDLDERTRIFNGTRRYRCLRTAFPRR